MSENLFQNIPINDRASMLEANCLKHEEQTVKRQFTHEELEDMRITLTDDSIKNSELEDELKALTKPIREELKNYKAVIREKLKKLKLKYDENLETVYLFDDQENGMMNTYDVTGELLSSRKLLPSEKQTRIIDLQTKKQA